MGGGVVAVGAGLGTAVSASLVLAVSGGVLIAVGLGSIWVRAAFSVGGMVVGNGRSA